MRFSISRKNREKLKTADEYSRTDSAETEPLKTEKSELKTNF